MKLSRKTASDYTEDFACIIKCATLLLLNLKIVFIFSQSVAKIIPFDMEYSTGESGRTFTADNCSDIRYNGVEGCGNSTSNSSCAYNPLSVRCEKG